MCSREKLLVCKTFTMFVVCRILKFDNRTQQLESNRMLEKNSSTILHTFAECDAVHSTTQSHLKLNMLEE